MAMQATGMSFSKIVLLSGAAYTASIMATNGQLADILGRLQDGGKLFFGGQLIWEAVVDELMSAGMANAKQAYLLFGLMQRLLELRSTLVRA
ncbi:hypothetical protein Syun_029455 [Stephania yunnanensis]|uniref:Uncharacterized protein n=1 Tax=Stephania yunnanensis TaxID=152371 RepID=A0AAP0HJV5_9MAGN